MKTKEVGKIARSASNFGPVQLKVNKYGKLVTMDEHEPRFPTFAPNKGVVLMDAEQYHKLLNRLWEQHHLMLCS